MTLLKSFIASIIVAAVIALVVNFIPGELHTAGLAFVSALVGGFLTSLWVNKASGGKKKRKGSKGKDKGGKKHKRGKPVNGGQKETGSVKWFSASKGFGFITRDNGEDIFVHFRSIVGKGHRVLREGQRVEFEVTEGSKGLQAEDVNALKE